MSRCKCDGFTRGSEGLLSSIKLFEILQIALYFFMSFIFLCFRFLIHPLLSAAGFSVPITESCDEDVGEIGVDDMQKLIDKPGTTNGTKFDILQSILLLFLVRCGFTTFIDQILSELLQPIRQFMQ